MEKTPTFQVQAFGSYFLLERIAVGGMAEIFKAKQIGVRGFEKILVIKKILHHLSEDPEFVEMFEDEAKIAAQLTQANVVQIYELGEVEGTLYITMEYVEGKNLRDITRNCAQRGIHLSIEQCIFIMSEVLKGLDYAHRKTDSSGRPLDIVHRDMSPQNLIVSYEGEIKILDFGIAKAASKISKTEAGVLKGKFSYMSPEQASGKSIGQTTDIYACGVILHELLTSDRLFRTKSDMETLEKVKEGLVSPPSEKNAQVPRELDAITLKALTKDQNARYQSAGEMLNDLNRLVNSLSIRYSSQDFAIFMRTLFSGTIAEEKERLIQALSRIPPSGAEQLSNAKTHIAFKRSLIAGEKRSLINGDEDPKAEGELQSDQTFTVSKKMGSLDGRKKKRLLLGSLTLVLLALSIYIFGKRSHSPVDELPITIATPQVPEIKPPVPPVQVPPNEKPVESPKPSPEKNTGGVVDQTLGKVSPPPPEDLPLSGKATKVRRKEPKKLEPSPEPSPELVITPPVETPPVQPVAPAHPSRPKTKAFGSLDVMAPTEGFAQLLIDGKSHGTVPGPKARGIVLEEGSHAIQCTTSKHSYSGRIDIVADQSTTVKCQDLKIK